MKRFIMCTERKKSIAKFFHLILTLHHHFNPAVIITFVRIFVYVYSWKLSQRKTKESLHGDVESVQYHLSTRGGWKRRRKHISQRRMTRNCLHIQEASWMISFCVHCLSSLKFFPCVQIFGEEFYELLT